MKKILFLSLCCFISPLLFACTTFCIQKNGQVVFGRNYDWITGAGIVNTNQRGLVKSSMSDGPGTVATWISKYGSITFNQYGKEFPTGGMNEKGLVVELMWLDGTVYPSADARPAIGVLQWIQYQLDNAASTEEVIASDAQIRISEKGTPIHYLVADASGATASIEFLNGRMVVHKGETLPFPVLTNDTYAASAATAQPLLGQNVNLRNNSLDRYVKACNMVKQFKETDSNLPLTDFAFSILNKVSQGSYTQWSIVYDITAKKIYFKTEANKEIKAIDFSAFDFACSSTAKMFNMNQPGTGDVSGNFILPDKKLKRQIMRQVAEESSSQVSISKKEEEALLSFENGVNCKQ